MSELSRSQYESDVAIQKPRMFPAKLLRKVRAVNDPAIDKWIATVTHGEKYEEFVAPTLSKAQEGAAFCLYKAQQNNFDGFGEFSNE